VDNQAIGKYDKTTGKLVKKWQGDKKGPFLDLDSAMVMDGKSTRSTPTIWIGR
jgi:hypothetical protein